MANPEHLAILEQDVKAWNAWREKNPGGRPDLNEAHLSEEHLSEADLSGADLRGATLSRTYF